MGFFRLLLAISVIISHCGAIWKFKFIDGRIAVETFFIISGFYMTLILNEKYVGKNSSYSLFIINRFLKLYPVYWAVLILTCILAVVVYYISAGQTFPIFSFYFAFDLNTIPLIFLIAANLMLIGQDAVMFLGVDGETGGLFFTENFWITDPQLNLFLFVPQAWTLSLEIFFYLLAPFLLRKRAIVILVIIFLSAVLRFYLYNSLRLRYDPWTYRFFPTEIFFFLLGYISYRIYESIRRYRINIYLSTLILGFIVLATIFFGYLPSDKSSILPFPGKELVYFMYCMLAIPILFNQFKNSKLDRRIGELSYPVYISHILVISLFSTLPYPYLGQSWFIVLFTILFSFLLQILISDPIEKYRQRRIREVLPNDPQQPLIAHG